MTEQTAELKYAHAILTLQTELIKLSARHIKETDRFLRLCQKEFSDPTSKAAIRHDEKIVEQERKLLVLSELSKQTEDAINHLRGKETTLETMTDTDLAEHSA